MNKEVDELVDRFNHIADMNIALPYILNDDGVKDFYIQYDDYGMNIVVEGNSHYVSNDDRLKKYKAIFKFATDTGCATLIDVIAYCEVMYNMATGLN